MEECVCVYIYMYIHSYMYIYTYMFMYSYLYISMFSCSVGPNSATLWTIAPQAPLSM